MNIIPVLDLMNGLVVHAKHGNRHEYLPIKSVLTDSIEPLAVAQALLSLYPFKQLYIADISAIQKTGNHKNTILEITNNFPNLEIWLDAGYDNEASINAYQGPNIKPVLGTESLSKITQYQALSSASQHRAILSLDYKMKDESALVKYVYVSDYVMKTRPKFLEESFVALGIPEALRNTVTSSPNLIFSLETTSDFGDWNMCLPSFKRYLPSVVC